MYVCFEQLYKTFFCGRIIDCRRGRSFIVVSRIIRADAFTFFLIFSMTWIIICICCNFVDSEVRCEPGTWIQSDDRATNLGFPRGGRASATMLPRGIRHRHEHPYRRRCCCVSICTPPQEQSGLSERPRKSRSRVVWEIVRSAGSWRREFGCGVHPYSGRWHGRRVGGGGAVLGVIPNAADQNVTRVCVRFVTRTVQSQQYYYYLLFLAQSPRPNSVYIIAVLLRNLEPGIISVWGKAYASRFLESRVCLFNIRRWLRHYRLCPQSHEFQWPRHHH